jgi:hypothetical protein
MRKVKSAPVQRLKRAAPRTCPGLIGYSMRRLCILAMAAASGVGALTILAAET